MYIYFFVQFKPKKVNFSIFPSDWFVEFEKNSFISLCLKSSFFILLQLVGISQLLGFIRFFIGFVYSCMCVFVFESVFRFYVYCTYNNMCTYYVRRYLICTFLYPLKTICNMCRVHRVGNEEWMVYEYRAYMVICYMHKMIQVTQYFFFLFIQTIR